MRPLRWLRRRSRCQACSWAICGGMRIERMGAVVEGGKAVSGIVDSLKTQPLSLALVIMNLALLGMLYYIAEKSSTSRQHSLDLIYHQQEKVQEMFIAHCTTGAPRP